MLLQILTNIHNITTMMFGIFISSFFLGIKQNRKNILTLFVLFCFEGSLYVINYSIFGETFANRIYPFIVHLPLALFLFLYYRYPLISACTSVFSAYLCCQLSNWIGLLFFDITSSQYVYYAARIMTTCIVFVILCKYVCRTTQSVFAKEKWELCIIGFLPFTYYVFDYISTKFSNLLYSGNKAVVEFMGFAFCIAYLVFLIVYFKESESRQEARQYNELMKMQLSSIEKEISQVKISKNKLAILRHDMRHHLSIIHTYITNNDIDKAQEYIKEISNAYDDTIITSYCKNEMLNSVISIYNSRFENTGLSLQNDISISDKLPCNDMAFCTILSNALENSMHALENMDIENKWAKLTLSQKGSHILLQIENPVQKIPRFADGIPVSDKKGHGIGVKSIVYYVEKLNGQCQFFISEGLFILRIII
ncbi:GHKL domain-containing protein [Eubacterium sp. MSJ-13]|nr:GHKL domain-containing protein [Eubacterium sp. MSJ-13]MBU5478159.1 GHKL domain-containing protein [Eubacterium sp. MSJ-13]